MVVVAAVWWTPPIVIASVPPIVGRADPATAPAAPVSPVPTTGTLVVARLPRQGTIWLDGVRAKQPIELRPGTHRLRLEAPGYLATKREVVAVAGRTDTVTFAGTASLPPAPTGFLWLRVTPFARVSIDGRFVAEDEVIRVPLAAGTHRLSYNKDGFEARDTTVSVPPGDTVKVRVTLRKPE